MIFATVIALGHTYPPLLARLRHGSRSVRYGTSYSRSGTTAMYPPRFSHGSPPRRQRPPLTAPLAHPRRLRRRVPKAGPRTPMIASSRRPSRRRIRSAARRRRSTLTPSPAWLRRPLMARRQAGSAHRVTPLRPRRLGQRGLAVGRAIATWAARRACSAAVSAVVSSCVLGATRRGRGSIIDTCIAFSIGLAIETC